MIEVRLRGEGSADRVAQTLVCFVGTGSISYRLKSVLRGDVAMNLIGLILIAALSGGIVAVSLRLRASASSARAWSNGDTR